MTLPLLGAPDPEPRRCRHCHRPIKVGPVVDGLGSECARQRGLLPPAAPSPPQWQQDGPDLFDAARDTAARPSNVSNDQA